MTQEDLDQIGNLISANNQVVEEQTRSLISANNRVVEEQTRNLISANNQVLFEAMRAIEDHVDQSIGQLRDELSGRLAHVACQLDRTRLATLRVRALK
jgi:hypothetical protein